MTVDAARVQTFLDGPWAWIRDAVREQLRDPLFHPVHDLGTDAYRERVFEQAKVIATTRAPKLGFPKEYGGEGDIGAWIAGFETLGHGDLSLLVKAGVQWGLFGGAILHLGTERHHERYLADMMSLELPGCFAMTETGHGSDVAAVRTTATYLPDTEEFEVHTPDEDARKDYIGNAAAHGRMAAVFAQLITMDESHGVHAFLVPIRDGDGGTLSGVTIEDCGRKAGLNGVDNGRIWFDHVRVPRDALLDRYGQVAPDGTYTSPIENVTRRFFTMLGTLIQGRVSVSGAALNATKTALTIAIRYGDVRRQFAPPDSSDEVVLLDFLEHQRRLLPALASTYALEFAQEALLARLADVLGNDDADDHARRQLESMAAGIKTATTWHATRTIQTCREACGGAGYLAENRLPQLKADTDVFTTFEGDNTVLLQLVAKGLLTDFRDEFGSLDTLGMVRFVAEQVVSTVVERTSARTLIQALIDAVPGREEERELLDRGYQLELYSFREEHVVEGVARRIRRGVSQKRDPFEVFNLAQDHVLLAARVHIDRLVLEHFVAAIDRCEDEEVREVLERLCDLHVLSQLERDRAWFLEHGRLTPARAKAITPAVNDLCRELRPLATLLVDAFGVPDECVAAPIALGAERRRQDAKRGDATEDASSPLEAQPAPG